MGSTSGYSSRCAVLVNWETVTKKSSERATRSISFQYLGKVFEERTLILKQLGGKLWILIYNSSISSSKSLPALSFHSLELWRQMANIGSIISLVRNLKGPSSSKPEGKAAEQIIDNLLLHFPSEISVKAYSCFLCSQLL